MSDPATFEHRLAEIDRLTKITWDPSATLEEKTDAYCRAVELIRENKTQLKSAYEHVRSLLATDRPS